MPDLRTALRALLVVSLTSGLSACGTMTDLQSRFIFPNANEGPMDRPPPAGAEQIWLTAQDGSRVEGWLFLPSSPQPAPAVLFIHGNSDYIESKLEYADLYLESGYAVLLMEYRGYRRSTGTPTEAALREDAEAFYDVLASRREIDPARISVHGVSLGGAIAAEVAAARQAHSLILQSTFPSIRDLLATVYVPRFVVTDEFNTRAALDSFAGPVLILHGDRDEIVPERLARSLAGAEANRRLVVLAGDHDLPHDWRAFAEIVRDFLGAEPENGRAVAAQ